MNCFLAPTSAETLDTETLPLAIGKLLELNNYDVSYSVDIFGAEVDIVATPKENSLQSKVYIEATVEYVDVTKYGKDLTKLALIKEKDRSSILIIVSAIGFTNSVAERANNSGIQTKTYDEFFRSFERFTPYIDYILSQRDIQGILSAYEPPRLVDTVGNDDAIAWFSSWHDSSGESRWVVLLGEYGTGKTAITMYLQGVWLKEYKINPKRRIPIRIELRNFARQFDANSLLHYFLDTNKLSHIPIEYIRYLIRVGRVVILLDGYDEMAQFMNSRERRSCLGALAELANEGAIGLLTSRPNYFTESEELSVFDALYVSIEKHKYFTGSVDQALFEEEKHIDELLENYIIKKRERSLCDLDATQTENLVRRKLSGDHEGQNVVLGILRRVFRSEGEGSSHSLAGKPVIVSYLLELIDELKAQEIDNPDDVLTEWLVYKLIVDRLMLRDFRRSPLVAPDQRRKCLQRLALHLSKRGGNVASQEDIFETIDAEFKSTLRFLSGDDRRTKRDELFQDIRSSSTLTRCGDLDSASGDSWRFSHNSIREYMVAESIINSIISGYEFATEVKISDAMRTFVASLSSEFLNKVIGSLRQQWATRARASLGLYVSLLWDAMSGTEKGLFDCLSRISGGGGEAKFDLSDISLSRTNINPEVGKTRCAKFSVERGSLSALEISGMELAGSNFSNSILESVTFTDCDLKDASFSGAYLFECIFDNVKFTGADFTRLERGSNFVVRYPDGRVAALSDEAGIGYLRFHGAKTDSISSFFIAMHHPYFQIVRKICQNISEQRKSQLRGLTQRGAAHENPAFAREFMQYLYGKKYIEIDTHELVSATAEGRREMLKIVEYQEIPAGLEKVLDIEHLIET